MTISAADVARDILAKSSGPSYDGGPIYIHHADGARLIRATLAAKFPGTKFYVRSRSFAGGSAIDVYYDGIIRYDDDPRYGPGAPKVAVYRDGAPALADVKAVVDAFGGSDFDGSIDMAYDHDAFLAPDGTVTYGGTTGTAGSMGYVPASKPVAPAGAVRVHFLSYLHVYGSLPYDVRKAA